MEPNLHYPPADPRLTYDAALTDRLYRAYHRLFARAWNNDHVRQLAISQQEMIVLLGCGRSTMYALLKELVSQSLIAYYSEHDRFVITFKTPFNTVQVPGLNGDESKFLDLTPAPVQVSGLRIRESRIPGQVESPGALKELINTVVVVNPDQEDPQPLLLGDVSPETWTDAGKQWPVAKICDEAGVKPGSRPGQARWLRFIAWLIYGYRNKADEPGKGIVTPIFFALKRLDMQPANVYLEMAAAGPVELLDDMRPYKYPRRWPESALAGDNGLRDLLEPYVRDYVEDADEQDDEE